ncbi:adenylate/guanylate cyclase domain-containing protein, partial [Elusimicrobiota bacterium]
HLAQFWCSRVWPEFIMKPHIVTVNIISILFMGLIAGNVVFQLRAIVLKLVRDIMKRERAEGALTRYLSRQVAEQVLAREDGDALMSGRRQHVAVLFSDIRGFTAISESMDPVELLSLLNRYFRAMIEVIFKHEGTLDKFVGDAVMVVFGAPLEQADAELRAVRCAREMHAALDDFNRSQTKGGGRQIPMGITIHAGEVVAGNLGSEERMEYTVLGDVVNLTQRLQSKAKAGQTIVSDTVHERARSKFKFEALAPFKVKGKADPVTAFRLLT